MPTRETLLLHPDRPLRLDAVRHAELCVESGTVWITASDLAGDLFLTAGERYCVPKDGVVLVEAVRGAAGVRLETNKRHPVSVLIESCRAMLTKGLATP